MNLKISIGHNLINFSVIAVFSVGIILAFALLFNIKNLNAVFEGPEAPTIASNNTSFGSELWLNTSNVFASDNARASATLVRGERSNYIVATGFNFSAVPDSAVITGILAEVEKSEGGLAANRGIRDRRVRVLQDGAIMSADDKADTVNFWPDVSSESFSSYGGAGDLWGLSWSVIQIKSSSFGIAISAINDVVSPGSGRDETAQIDSIRITVYYDAPSLGIEQVSYRWRNDNGGESALSQSAGFTNPDGDFLASWNVVNPGPLHFEVINEGGTPNTSDYIESSNQSTDTFDMETITGSGLYTRVDIFVYALTANNDRIGVNLVINGTDQTEQTLIPGTVFAWHNVSFSGLSLSESDLGGIRVKLRHIRRGGVDSVRVATMRAEIFNQVPAATFKADENTLVTGQKKNENARIRFLIRNNDPFSTGSINYRLEFSPMVGASCGGGDEIFADVPPESSCGTFESCMAASSYFTNQDLTQNISPGISDPIGSFQAGRLVEDPSNETVPMSLGGNSFVELEYAIYFTSNAVSGEYYCFRVTNIDSYTNIAQIRIAAGYAASGTYISSAFNAGFPSVFNVIEWTWSKSDISCGVCNVRMQIQTAPDAGGVPGLWPLTWSGPEGEDGDETDYFTISTGELIHTDHNEDQWIRYRATLDGDGANTAALEEARIYYR